MLCSIAAQRGMLVSIEMYQTALGFALRTGLVRYLWGQMTASSGWRGPVDGLESTGFPHRRTNPVNHGWNCIVRDAADKKYHQGCFSRGIKAWTDPDALYSTLF